MELATEQDTRRFLEGLWYRWGTKVLQEILKGYDITEQQRDALEQVLLKPGDWCLEVEHALRPNH